MDIAVLTVGLPMFMSMILIVQSFECEAVMETCFERRGTCRVWGRVAMIRDPGGAELGWVTPV